jgi:hypothetical protein
MANEQADGPFLQVPAICENVIERQGGRALAATGRGTVEGLAVGSLQDYSGIASLVPRCQSRLV